MEEFRDADFKNLQTVSLQGKTVLVAEVAGVKPGQTLLAAAVYDSLTGARPKFALLPFPEELRLGGASLITVPHLALPFDIWDPGFFQIVADDDRLYLFRAIAVPDRQGGAGDDQHARLFANRYVLVEQGGGKQDEPASYALARCNETRFKKSGLKETPADAHDTLSAKDGDGNLFIEPVLQLSLPRDLLSDRAPLHGYEEELLTIGNGFFGMSLTPSDHAGKQRWLFLTAVDYQGYHLRTLSFLRDSAGWPDLMRVEDIAVREVVPCDDAGNPVKFCQMPACLLFQRQETIPGARSTSLTGPRVMVAARTSGAEARLACFDLALAADGTPVLTTDEEFRLPRSTQPARLALEFDGSGQWAQGNTDYWFANHTTVEAWFKRETPGTAMTIFRRKMSAADTLLPDDYNGILFEQTADGLLHFSVEMDAFPASVGDPNLMKTLEVFSHSPVDLTRWQHVAAVCNAGRNGAPHEMSVYLNGIPVPLTDNAGPSPVLTMTFPTKPGEWPYQLSASGPVYFGGSPVDAENGRRWISEVRYWNSPRSAGDIVANLYRSIDPAKHVADDTDCLGSYWPASYWKDGDRSALPASGVYCGQDGKLTAAVDETHWVDWALSGPPGLGLDDGTLSAEGLSSGMGILEFLGTPATLPALLSGADGKIHLYYGKTTDGTGTASLEVAHFDTTTTRAVYQLALAGGADATGVLSLAARHVGRACNSADTANVVELSQSALTFAYKEGGKPLATEVFKNVPTDADAFMQVVNGTASGDPLQPDVRSGLVPYYDYGGTRTAIAVATEAAPLLFVDPAPIGTSRSVKLGDIRVSTDDGKVTLTITFKLPDTFAAGGAPVLTIAGLPPKARALAAALGRDDLGGATATWQGPPIKTLDAGSGQILAIGAHPDFELIVANDSGRTCNVEVRRGDTAIWTRSGISRAPGEFIAALGAASDHVVLIGNNVDGPVRAREPATDEAPIDLGALFCVLGAGADGDVLAADFGPLPPQGYTATNPEGLPTRTQPRGSVLFAATGVTAPADASALTVQEGIGMLARPGTDGSWVIMPTLHTGDFSQAQAIASDAAPSLGPDGSFTYEGWFRPDAPAGPYKLISSNCGANAVLQANAAATGQLTLGVAAGGPIYSTQVALSLGEWSHIALVAPQTYAIDLNQDPGRVKNGEKLNPARAFAVDGVIRRERPTDDPKGRSIIVSKIGADKIDEHHSVQGGFSVYVLDGKSLCAEFYFFDANDKSKSYYFSPTLMDIPDDGEDYYFAISAVIDSGESSLAGPDTNFSYKEEPGKDNSGSATLTSKRTYNANLTCNAMLVDRNGKSTESGAQNCPITDLAKKPNFQFTPSGAGLSIGGGWGQRSALLDLAGLRLWNVDIWSCRMDLAFTWDVPAAVSHGLAAEWRFHEGKGTVAAAQSGDHEIQFASEHVWKRSDTMRVPTLYVDASPMALTWNAGAAATPGRGLALGAGLDGTDPFAGRIADIRLWSEARTATQIADNRFAALSGDESGLVSYWPITTATGTSLKDSCGSTRLPLVGTVKSFWKQAIVAGDPPPVGDEHPIVCNAVGGVPTTGHVTDARSPACASEYGAIVTDAAGNLSGVQLRGYAYIVSDPANSTRGVLAFEERFKVGDADLIYMGQVQTDPAIIGYIEGAPPVPMENLTRPYYTSIAAYTAYAGISSVSFAESQQVRYSYTTTGVSTDTAGMAAKLGARATLEVSSVLAPLGGGVMIRGLRFLVDAGMDWKLDYSYGQQTVALDSLGRNDSSMTTLSLRGKWEPAPKSRERRYVPGNIGMALVISGIADVYGLRLKRTGTLAGLVMRPEGAASRDVNLIHFPIDPSYTKQGTLDGKVGFANDPAYPDADIQRESYFKPDEAHAYSTVIGTLETQLEKDFEKRIFNTTPDANGVLPHSRFHDSQTPDFSKFKGLGNLGKTTLAHKTDDLAPSAASEPRDRDLVNTYVWTAAGGLQVESKSSVSSRTDTYGANYDFKWNWGGLIKGGADPGVYVEGAALLGHQMVVKLEKSRTLADDFSISAVANCEGFLANWPYDAEGRPPAVEPVGDFPAPGKVDAYRFKTFYLAPTHDAYDHLFNTVIDQTWLANSTSPDAIALRQVQGEKKDVWRVFHRVTYVSRVPPKVNQNPSDSAVKVGPPVINLAANGGLLQLISKKKKQEATSEEIVSQAVAEILGAGGQLAAFVPWWGSLVAAAQAESPPAGNAAAVYACHRATRAYFVTYFGNPSAAV